MSNFPALRPATVLITPGAAPVTVYTGYDGSTVTSTADLLPSGDILIMTFEGITEAEARSVLNHQQSQEGKSFLFNSATLATTETPAGLEWTYAIPISQDDILATAQEFYRLEVKFVGVWIRWATAPSASARIELRTTAAKALPTGTPSASTIIRLTTTGAGMATGTPSQSTFLLLRTTPGNVVDTSGMDVYLSNVVTLLLMQGADGSLTFTDSSQHSRAVSRVKYAENTTLALPVIVAETTSEGATLARFSGGGQLELSNTDNLLTMPGDFTVELVLRRTEAELARTDPAIGEANLSDWYWSGIVGGDAANSQFTINGDAWTGRGTGTGGKIGILIQKPDSSFSYATSSSSIIPFNEIVFISYTRLGSTIWAHVNGTLAVTLTGITQPLTFSKIGITPNRNTFIGDIFRVRITRDVARYYDYGYIPPANFPSA